MPPEGTPRVLKRQAPHKAFKYIRKNLYRYAYSFSLDPSWHAWARVRILSPCGTQGCPHESLHVRVWLLADSPSSWHPHVYAFNLHIALMWDIRSQQGSDAMSEQVCAASAQALQNVRAHSDAGFFRVQKPRILGKDRVEDFQASFDMVSHVCGYAYTCMCISIPTHVCVIYMKPMRLDSRGVTTCKQAHHACFHKIQEM